MKVRYIGETKLYHSLQSFTIINGGIYEAYYMFKDFIYLVGINGLQEVYNFETLDGNPIQYIDNDINLEHISIWRFEKLEEDDLFMCCSTKLKTLTHGKIYTLDDFYKEDEWELKFKDIKSNRGYGRHNFKRLSKPYVRNLKIKKVLNETDNNMSARFKHDGIPIVEYETKFKILLDFVSNANNYINYTGVIGISIFDILKDFNHHLIEDKDIDNFSNMTIKEILNKKL